MGLTLSENATAFWNIDKINYMKRGKIQITIGMYVEVLCTAVRF